MIELAALTLYEILDVDPRASTEEIKRAYQIALKSYGTDHMATYGLFTPAQKERILDRVQQAYTILMDPERRREYDDELRKRGDYPADNEMTPSTEDAKRASEAAKPESHGEGGAETRAGQDRLIAELLADAEEFGEWSGKLLREVREIRGMTLDDIAQRTKISRGHLRSIEQESYDYLPPDIYVKGFVTQMVKLLGLDPERTVHRLVAHIRWARKAR